MSESILVSVVVPTCARLGSLAECLRCLAPGVQTVPASEYEVIVADDAKGAKTARELVEEKFSWAKWVRGPGKGPAANRNSGARTARGEWLAFTDDDCIPDPGWLYALREGMSRGALAMEGAIHPVGALSQDMAHCPVNLEGGRFWTANVALRKSLFQQVGGFDENFARYNEDQDIELRIKTQTAILFVPAAKVSHPVVIVPLMRALLQIPVVARDWAYYKYKHRKLVGCASLIASELKSGTYFWLHNSLRSLLGGRARSLVKALAMLTVGQGLVIYEILKLGRPRGHAKP